MGISEKVALSVQFVAAFVTGFVVAYARSWRLALAMTSILPCIAIAGGVMNRFVSRYMQMSLKHVADGGSLAEEVISTIRTAQAFGTQRILSSLYDSYIDQAHVVDVKAAAVHGAGLSTFFFIIYSSYALAFNFGTTLVIHGHATVGIIVNVFIAILIGSFSLAMLAPEMQGKQYDQFAAPSSHTDCAFSQRSRTLGVQRPSFGLLSTVFRILTPTTRVGSSPSLLRVRSS